MKLGRFGKGGEINFMAWSLGGEYLILSWLTKVLSLHFFPEPSKLKYSSSSSTESLVGCLYWSPSNLCRTSQFIISRWKSKMQ